MRWRDLSPEQRAALPPGTRLTLAFCDPLVRAIGCDGRLGWVREGAKPWDRVPRSDIGAEREVVLPAPPPVPGETTE